MPGKGLRETFHRVLSLVVIPAVMALPAAAPAPPDAPADGHIAIVNKTSGVLTLVDLRDGFWHGTVSVLDLRNRSILAQVETGEGTEEIGLSPDDRFLHTTSPVRHEIVNVDTATLKVVARHSTGA